MDGVVQPSASPSERVRDVRVLRTVRRAEFRRFVACELDGERERLVDKLGRFKQAVREAELVRSAAVQHPVPVQRVLHDELDRGLRADELRNELRAAPAWDDPEQALRAGEMPHRRRDSARVAMQCDFDAAAEAGAVDRGHRRVRERADAPEELVARPAALAGELGVGTPRELVEVGARREEVGLARDDERGPVLGLERAEHARERLERRAAEDRRLRVVGPVVDRDQRDRPVKLRLHDTRQLELGQRLRHAAAQARSHTSAAPMPMPTQSAVRP